MQGAEANTQALRPRLELVWSGAASTKFRAPKLRRDIVSRAALVRRAREFAMERRVTLVYAPAGAGKSTLLAQLAALCQDEATIVWLSLDEDDSDANRLFASLLTALRDVRLEWEVDPQTLGSQVLDAGAQSRAAVALVVNALCSFDGDRLLIVLDDLHRVVDADALKLLNHLIERLPPEVGIAIGTRVVPDLPFARWRSQGELGELAMGDLQFDLDEVQALATVRLADEATPELARRALRRTHGWAAGLQLLLGAALRNMAAPAGDGSSRHMFDFLAHEVLADLPEDLRTFALNCSILSELSPVLCDAVMQRADSRRMLDELYRRNLFVTVVDESTPVLKFHDLFREFLQGELDRQDAQLIRALHGRAAQAEPVSPRAVVHWLKAQQWDDAITLMHRCTEPLLAEGGHAMVERWIAQLPDAVAGRHDVVYLRGLCAWSRWDYPEAARCLESAAKGYRAAGDQEGYALALTLLPRTYNSGGDLEAAARVLTEIEGLQLDARQQAALDAARAWQALAAGEPDRVAPALQALADQAERDPTVLIPAINDLFNSFLFGLPGTMKPLRRLRELCAMVARQRNAPWQIEAMAHTAWPEIWHGEYAAAESAVARQTALAERLFQLNALQSGAVHAAATGDFERGSFLERHAVSVLDALQLPMLSRSWRRVTTFNLAGIYWMAQDRESLEGLLPVFVPERDRFEWPIVDTGRALVRGRCALLRGDLAEAEAALDEACALHRHWRLPTFLSDPRISMAILRLEQGDRAAAWAAFGPVMQELVAEDCLGPLLMEPREPLERLLGLMPPAERGHPGMQRLIRRLDRWRVSDASTPIDAGGPLRVLSQREREVLARIAAGDSNKLIARALDLSPHTVKRHVANILDKLAVSTRNAAATMYRQHT